MANAMAFVRQLMKRSHLLLVLTPLLLASCGGSGASSSNSSSSSIAPSCEPSSSKTSSSEEEEAFTEKEINVYYAHPDWNQKTKLRFYESASDVPYISIQEFYALLLKNRSKDPARNQLTVTVAGDQYAVASPTGKAVFDIGENTMSSDMLPFFTSTKTYETGYNAMMGTDGMPWIKIETVEPSADPKPTMVDFDDYEIDLHGDEKNLYLPLPTLQDLFSDTSLLTSSYNRKDLYIYTGFDEGTNAFGAEFYEPCLKTNIGLDYARYLYNELCFNYDVLLGRPTRSSLERYYDLSKGLDHALSSRPYGRMLKQNLLDGTPVGYATGLMMLGQIAADGGHTSINPFSSLNSDPETKTPYVPSWYERLLKQVNDVMETLREIGYEELTNSCKTYQHHVEIRQNRHDGLGLAQDTTDSLRGEQTYKKVNSTAFILIDDYMGDTLNAAEWKDYYAGKGELPYGENKGGSVASLYKGLIKAGADESVKNVVVDLSSNLGGSVDEMMYLITLLTDNPTMKLESRTTGQDFDVTFAVDRNLDAKFDEADKDFNPIKGKNVAVLMSQNGFSCGGISPIYLHDRGIFTMGDDSGGGCCSILYQHTGVGLRTVRSSTDAVLDKNGKKIDLVREGSCDHKFEIKSIPTESGRDKLDFSAFFEVNEIERVIAERFKA